MGEEGRRESWMEDWIENLVGEVGDKGKGAIENPGDTGRTVEVGDERTAASVADSSWLKPKIWLRGRELRLGKVPFPTREVADVVLSPAFSSLLERGLWTVWTGAGCLRDNFPTILMERKACEARALKVMDLDMCPFFPTTEGISFPTL